MLSSGCPYTLALCPFSLCIYITYFSSVENLSSDTLLSLFPLTDPTLFLWLVHFFISCLCCLTAFAGSFQNHSEPAVY